MSEINDFGFTAVDQDELKTKTGEDAGIGEEVAEQLKAVAASSAGQANSAQIEALDSKVDLLQKLISNALGELDDHKDNLVAIDTKKELFEELNKENTKPKVKQKIRNELVRRGIKIVKRAITNE